MKQFLLSLFVFMIFILNACSEDNNIEMELTGNWHLNPNPGKTVINQYSWGEGKTVINFALEIDLYNSEKTIRLPMIGGPFKVTEFKYFDENIISLTFFFDRGGFDVTYHIHQSENDTIWFELITERELTFIPIGPGSLWYKIAGPTAR